MRKFALFVSVACICLSPVTAQKALERHGISTPVLNSATTPLSVLLADPPARGVIERQAPKLLTIANLPQGRGMTLADVQPFANGVLTAAVVTAIDSDLAKLPASAGAAKLAGDAIAEIDGAVLDPENPWITHPDAFAADFARQPIALQFRRVLRLTGRPTALRVRVSADNRFVLYVNGARVAAGPAQGDLAHWRYAVVDLAPHLRAGTNVIAARV